MTTRKQLDSKVATGKGDDGTTGLLYGGDRIQKDDLRAEAYGTIDEAVAALGHARAELGIKAQYGVLSPGLAGLAELILRFQRELFVAAAALATHPAVVGNDAVSKLVAYGLPWLERGHRLEQTLEYVGRMGFIRQQNAILALRRDGKI